MDHLVKKAKRLLADNLSIFIIGAGSLGLFISNLLLKDILTVTEYSDYSILITYMAIISSFGLWGMEQTFLRISGVEKNGIVISRFLIKLLLLVLISNCILFPVAVNYFFNDNYLPSLILLSLFAIINLFAYNYFRLKQKFKRSQLSLNLWKVLLAGVVIYIVYFENKTGYILSESVQIVILLALFTSLTVPIFLSDFVRSLKSVKFDSTSKKEIFEHSLNFMLALLSLTLISQGEKFLIKERFGDQVLGEYFYLSTIFLYPFLFFQGYIGFKKFVYFKSNPTVEYFKKSLKEVTYLIFALLVASLGLFILLTRFNIISTESGTIWSYMLIFYCLGIIRVYYSIFSSAVGAFGSVRLTRRFNSYFLLFIALVAIVSLWYVSSIFVFLGVLIILWLVRLLFFGIVIYRSF